MLRFIVSLFNRKSQSTEPILQNNLDARDWSAHKAACRAEKLRAAREQSIGFVPAILQHIDREYIKLLCLTALASICLSALAMGQTMQEQKACYDQAHKVASKGELVSVSNHYDARTKTCWVREYSNMNGAIDESVYNAFEPGVAEAEFAGVPLNPTMHHLSDVIGVICFVHDTMCKNVAEFESLAKQRYGF